MARYVTKYQCRDCNYRFRRTHNWGDPDPDCPRCGTSPPLVPQRVAAPAIIGTKARAVDIAQRIAEEDYGLTNMRDNLREGEAAFIEPPPPKVEGPPTRQTLTKPAFLWGGAAPASLAPVGGTSRAQLLQNATVASTMARSEGKDPMELLHRAKPRLVAKPVNRES